MPISSFIGKYKSSFEQKSASPSSPCKGVDCVVTSCDNTYDGNIVLDDNSTEHAFAAILFPSKYILPNKENNLKKSSSENPDSPSSKQISASVSSQAIAWGSKPS